VIAATSGIDQHGDERHGLEALEVPLTRHARDDAALQVSDRGALAGGLKRFRGALGCEIHAHAHDNRKPAAALGQVHYGVRAGLDRRAVAVADIDGGFSE